MFNEVEKEIESYNLKLIWILDPDVSLLLIFVLNAG